MKPYYARDPVFEAVLGVLVLNLQSSRICLTIRHMGQVNILGFSPSQSTDITPQNLGGPSWCNPDERSYHREPFSLSTVARKQIRHFPLRFSSIRIQPLAGQPVLLRFVRYAPMNPQHRSHKNREGYGN